YADFDSVRAELALSKQNLPNNPRAFELAGLVDRRQGRWADATRNLERACELDPRNIPYHITLATTYLWLHDYDQMAKVMDRLLARLGLIGAALGRKQEALSEGRRALEVAPIAHDAMFGDCPNEVCVPIDFAMICAWTGDTELALEQLEAVTKMPGGPTYGEL